MDEAQSSSPGAPRQPRNRLAMGPDHHIYQPPSELPPPIGIALRPCSRADVPFIYQTHRTVLKHHVEKIWGWDEAWQEYSFNRDFKPSLFQMICLYGRDIGYLETETRRRYHLLRNVAVLPEFQGRGIGSTVLQGLIDQARAGGKAIHLQVLKSNPGAERLYHRLGFERYGEDETHFLMRLR